MSLVDYKNSLDAQVGTIPRIGPRIIKGITIGERRQEEEGFGRKAKTNRAKLVVSEAKRAVAYIEERQRMERLQMTAMDESHLVSDGMSISSYLNKPKEQLSSKPYKKTYAAVSVVDLYESKEGRKLEINFLGSPIKESWPKEESPGPLFADDSDVHADDSLSNSTIKSRRKAKIFVTDQGSVTSQKFITQRSHQLADGLHTTDISSARLSKYFGDESKAKFYDTYRELKRQKLLLPIKKNSKGFVEPDLDVLISASVDDHPVNKSIADLVGLGVIRPSTEGGRKKGRQDDDSGTEIYNVHSFEESVCSARDGGDSVTSSITDRPRRAIAQSVPIDSDDESLFSDADMDAVQTPVKPLFPFVSIFSNEKISDRRISRVLEGADVAKLSIDYEENARKPLSAPKDGEMLVQRNSLGSLSNNYSGMPESPRQRDKPSMVTQNTKLGNAVGPKRKESKVAIDKPTLPNRRSSASAASSAKPKKDEMRKQVSCMGKLDVTKKPVLKSNTKDSLVGEPSPYLVISPVNATLKRLNSGNEFASFASTNSFEATNLRASSIEEHSGFQESAAGGLRLSRALREDVESDDEDIIFGGDNEGYLSYGCNSPRAKFLAGCIDKKIPPRNALMLRSKVSSVLFLEHHGMGDDLALLLAPALVAMPLVSGVNIADNNLSDIGLEAIISSIAKCEHVRDVDISQNTIGPKAAAALARLLGNKECKLSKITMKKANIDDGECERFVEALKDNRYLQELDMSDNLLGKDENLNAVKPDIVTAGEALASLLREGQCPLTTLKIAWNMIRMEGAYELCTALEACRTLEHIDLSFNALGRESGIALGSSIELMPRLKELLLSNNGLDPMAAFTLCVGARECPSMTYLCLDNNPVGDLGMRAILTNVVYCGSRLTISARGCDFILVMPNCHYRRADPVGCYDITLSNGFDRAILLDAMDAVAMHQSLFIEDFQYSYEQNDLDQTLTKFNEKKLADAFDRHENKEIDSLNRMHRILSNDNVKKKMIQVFNERQHEGSIDKTVMGLYRDEAVDIIEGIGRVEYSESQFRTLFAYYDVCDDSTIITSFIFIQMIDKIESEALLRIRDATHLPRFSVNGGKTRYVPPQVGRIRMKVVDNFVNRPDGYGLTNYQTQMMHHMSQNHADVSIGLGAVMELFKVRCEEATSIFHILMESTADPANALATILPCLTTSPDIRAITNMYGRNPTTQRRLEQRMGNAYKAYVGPVDGFYHIDLRVSTDRLCLKKLMQISASNSQLRKMKNLGDISQYGDWSSFRNKHFVHPISDGAGERQSEIRLTNEGLTPMPTSGIIEFDFSGAPRGYVKKAEVISNEWFLSALIQTGLTTEESRPNDIQWLQDVELRQRKNSTGAGQSLWQRDLGRAAHISAYLHEKIFNPSQLNKRHSRIIESLAKERMLQSELTAKAKAEADAIASKKRMEELEKKRNYGRARSSNLLSRPPSRGGEESAARAIISRPVSRGGENATILAVPSNVIEERITIDESDDNDDGINSDNEFGAIDEFSEAEINKAFTDNKSASSSEGGRVRSKPSSGSSAKKSIDRYAVVKASKTMKCVIDTFDTSKLLYARQVAMIVSHFPDGCVMRTDYGSYRVEIVISLFWRIKDIQNFDIILSFLNASEAACVIGRLGLLTIFNPMKPENCYELDMAIYEQRQMVKMLMHYAVVEPGVNWFNQKYSVDRNNVNIPGWELPLMWNLKENLPEKGILCCKYYAGDGFCMKQCRPVKKLRFALLCLSLVCLDELRDEEAEFLLDKEKYRKIEIGDEIYSTPSGNTRKHQAKFVSESRVTGSSIPSKANTLKDLHDWLLKLEVTWNYDNISDSHP